MEADCSEPRVLDLDQLHNATLGEPDMIRVLLALLLEDTGQKMERLRSALRRRDAAESARLAHYIKGGCESLGAAALARIFRDLEHFAEASDWDACQKLLHDVPRETTRLAEASAALVNSMTGV